MQTKMIKAKEVCEIFGICRSTLKNLIRTQNLPVHNVGLRSYRFDPDEIKAWFESRKEVLVSNS